MTIRNTYLVALAVAGLVSAGPALAVGSTNNSPVLLAQATTPAQKPAATGAAVQSSAQDPDARTMGMHMAQMGKHMEQMGMKMEKKGMQMRKGGSATGMDKDKVGMGMDNMDKAMDGMDKAMEPGDM